MPQFNVSFSEPPEIAPFAFPPQMEIGTRLQVTCSVFSGDFPLTISWLKDGLPIPLDLRITEHNTPLASSLLFMEVRFIFSDFFWWISQAGGVKSTSKK